MAKKLIIEIITRIRIHLLYYLVAEVNIRNVDKFSRKKLLRCTFFSFFGM